MWWDFLREIGILLSGIAIGAAAVVLPVWSHCTKLEYENCTLRRRGRKLREIIDMLLKAHSEMQEKVSQELSPDDNSKYIDNKNKEAA